MTSTVKSTLFSLFFLAGASFCAIIFFLLHNSVVDFSILENYQTASPSILLDKYGKEWARFQLDKRKYVTLDRIPLHVQQAFLAAEDKNFFHHAGISFRGIVRSLLVNMYHRRKAQGASTITQQLVRLLFFNAQKTFIRKVKEQVLAILVEMQFCKEQILELYLNHVYFGHGIYGVQAAAKRFWGVSINEISVEQAATLAAIMKSPIYYSPISAPLSSLHRRNLIIKKMNEYGFISKEKRDHALEQQLGIVAKASSSIAPHYKESIRIFLEERFGKDAIYTQGLLIQTTLDVDVQKAAEKAFVDHMQTLKDTMHPKSDGGLISIDPSTGAIRAMIGGFDFATSKFNRALQAKRQIGSLIKPFVYAAALQKGKTLADTEVDEPFEHGQGKTLWRPRNHNHRFEGTMTLAKALSVSNNIVTIKTLLFAGIDNVIDLLVQAGIPSSVLQPYPSLALGAADVTLLQAVGLFNVFVNHGCYVAPYQIRWVKDGQGKKIYHHVPEQRQIISHKVASQLVKVLGLSIVRLRRLIQTKWFGGVAIGKTGTTNDSRTCWFCGATPDLTTLVYVGADDNSSLGNYIYGSRTSFPIWFYMHKALPVSEKKFYYDPTLQEVTIDWNSGLPAHYKTLKRDRATILI